MTIKAARNDMRICLFIWTSSLGFPLRLRMTSEAFLTQLCTCEQPPTQCQVLGLSRRDSVLGKVKSPAIPPEVPTYEIAPNCQFAASTLFFAADFETSLNAVSWDLLQIHLSSNATYRPAEFSRSRFKLLRQTSGIFNYITSDIVCVDYRRCAV
jgi:hypothetical protein